MKLPKNYFEGLSAAKYREYLKLLPNIHEEKTQLITMLIFTFAALSFFGIFAINPTLSTIIELKKQLSDSEFVHEQLKNKINNLSALQQRYTLLSSDLPVLYDVFPQQAAVPTLTGQVQSLADQSKLHLNSLRIYEVQLTTGKISPPKGQSYVFSLEAQGDYDNILKFVQSLSHFNRLVTLETIAVAKDAKKGSLVLSVRGRTYFKK